MAKLINDTDPRFFCSYCLVTHDVQIEELPDNAPWNGYRRTVTIRQRCNCEARGTYFDGTTSNPIKAKETTVTQQYETTTEKSVALSNVMNRVRKVEVALFNRAQELANVEAAHQKHITEASVALDRVLAESWQAGVNVEEYERFLPEYADKLRVRLEEVTELISLANVELPV